MSWHTCSFGSGVWRWKEEDILSCSFLATSGCFDRLVLVVSQDFAAFMKPFSKLHRLALPFSIIYRLALPFSIIYRLALPSCGKCRQLHAALRIAGPHRPGLDRMAQCLI